MLSKSLLLRIFLFHSSGFPITRELFPGGIQTYFGFGFSRVQFGYFHALLEFAK